MKLESFSRGLLVGEAAAVYSVSTITASSPPHSDNMFSSNSGLTDTFGSSGAGLKAIVTLAAVASHRVDATPVLADARLGATLVQVCQHTEEKDGRG